MGHQLVIELVTQVHRVRDHRWPRAVDVARLMPDVETMQMAGVFVNWIP